MRFRAASRLASARSIILCNSPLQLWFRDLQHAAEHTLKSRVFIRGFRCRLHAPIIAHFLRENTMNTVLADFAVCPCGEQCPVRPTKPARSNVNPPWSETGGHSIFVACWKCKRIYKFDTDSLVSLPINWDLAPYNPDSPMHIFHAYIRCDDPNCETPIEVLAIRNSSTSLEALQKETTEWRGENLRCPNGHMQSYPLEWK
jgi:hypothetical protein